MLSSLFLHHVGDERLPSLPPLSVPRDQDVSAPAGKVRDQEKPHEQDGEPQATTIKAALALTIARVCFVCLEKVAERQGTMDWDLGIITHRGPCSSIVDQERKDRTHSRRGRFRSREEVLARLVARREHRAQRKHQAQEAQGKPGP